MANLNVEIKARCRNPEAIRQFMTEHNADYKGQDHQADTYFNVANGRLKLREGNIENNLIYYERNNQQGPKDSFFKLVKVEDAAGLKEALSAANGIKAVVEKKRDIYYIANVKFHIDELPELGSFVEIEAGNILAPELTQTELKAQCDRYMQAFGIDEDDLVAESYSDMVIREV